jgi:hypothetical protein
MRTTQPLNRARIGYLSRAYSVGTGIDKALWDAWARGHPRPDGFGGTFIMSAGNAFTQLNAVKMRLFGGAYSASPPVTDLCVGIASLGAGTGPASGQIIINWTLNGVGVAGDKVEILAAGPFEGPNKVEIAGKMKAVANVAGNIATYTFATGAPGKWFWVGARYVQLDGQVSAPSIDHAMAKTP